MSEDYLSVLLELKADVKHFLGSLETHIKSDEKSFDKHDRRIGFVERAIWSGFGGLALLNVVLHFIK